MNTMYIIKRNGTKEEFNAEKIENAVKKAFKATASENDVIFVEQHLQKYIEELENRLKYKDITVETIQDEIENILIKYAPNKVTKTFILYREKHKNIRSWTDKKLQFISKYKESDNTANATIDDNSNVNSHNIGVLNSEIHKEDNILINRKMIINKLKEIYPNFDVNNYTRDLENHIIYKHDESGFSGAIAPYTYSPKEVVEVKSGENHWLVALDTLYDLIKEEETIVEKDVYIKYPEELYIKDLNQWTKVERLIKKKRHRDLVRVKTSFGEDIVVTDNHPLIINKNGDTLKAIAAINEKQFRTNPNIEFKGITELDIAKYADYTALFNSYILSQTASNTSYYSCKRHISLNEQFGYVIGFFVGDGHYDNTDQILSFTQKDKRILENLADIIYNSTGVASTLIYKNDKTKCWNLIVNSKILYLLFKNYFQIKDYAQNKNLPINILEFNAAFAQGIIEGLIDADGTVEYNNSTISIGLSSRECIHQLTSLLRYFNFNVANTIQNLPFSNSECHTNYTIWGVRFSNTFNCTKLTGSLKWQNLITKEITTASKYSDGWVNITKIELIQESAFLKQCDYIYDVTTESHTFLTSNILVHNCCSITMYPFLLNGIKEIGGLSAAPKNLDSFCGMYVNLIFAISAMFSGAVATSEFLVYFSYFCEKEWGKNYWQKPDTIISTEHCNRKKTIRNQIHQYWQQVIYSINQPAAARGLQSAFINFSYFDKYFFEGMFDHFMFPDGEKPEWDSVFWLQKEFMQWFNKERLKVILTFPVESYTLLYKDGEFQDKESFEFVCQEYERGHSFFTYISDTVDSLSSCCRLKNKLQTKEFNFTNGNIGVQTGSKSVITLNLNRIIQNWYNDNNIADNYKNKDTDSNLTIIELLYRFNFITYLKTILDRVYKYHNAYNELLWDMYNANLLPVYKAGFIDLNKQYLTIGLNGLNEAAEFLDIRCNDNPEYKKLCQLIFSTIKESNEAHKTKKLTFNTEQVPAESLAIKNYNWDKNDGLWVPEDRNLYASYIFIPSDGYTSILEKIKLHGKEYIGDYLDGGSACHLGLDHHLSKEQYAKLLKYAADKGCQYLTFNVPNSECNDCGFITKVPIKECPKCHSTKITYYDRIIGYLTAIKNWTTGRQIEQKTRIYHNEI